MLLSQSERIPEREQRLRRTRTLLLGAPYGDTSGSLSYFHHLAFFPARQGVDFLDLGFGDLLQTPGGSLRFVLGHLALLLHVIHAVQLVAPDVANRDPRLLRLLADELHVLLAALLGERRDRHSNHLAVVRRVETLLAGPQSLLDDAHLALVVDLHDEQPRLR